jgi:hypothetical protein
MLGRNPHLMEFFEHFLARGRRNAWRPRHLLGDGLDLLFVELLEQP